MEKWKNGKMEKWRNIEININKYNLKYIRNKEI